MGLLLENSSPSDTLYDRTFDGVRFVVEPGLIENLSLWYRGIIVTSRTYKEYEGLEALPKNLIGRLGSKQKTIYEVGAGMATFLPKLAVSSRHALINIDPLPYKIATALFLDAISISKIKKDTAKNIRSLLTIAELYANPMIIQTINFTLEELYQYEYEVHCKNADVVIDVRAARMYSPDQETVSLLENDWLLKNDFTNIVWSPGTFYNNNTIQR